MKPYLETKLGTLYCGNCLDILPGLPKVDLCPTDPPYGIGEAAGKNKSRGKIAISKDYGNDSWDNNPPSKKAFDLILSSATNQIIFGGNYFVEYLKNSSCWIVWNKRNGKSDFADCELAWTSFKTAVRLFDFRWAGMLQEYGGAAKEKRYHPTQKPISLFEDIIIMYSKSHHIIIDPYSGSGTTGLACQRQNRKWIMIEREEKYYELSAKRIEKETAQLDLFEDTKPIVKPKQEEMFV